MPTNWEKTGHTKAPLAKAIDYYMHPENLPKVHPGFVKEVKVISREGDNIKVEQRAAIMGRKIQTVNNLTLDRATNTFHVDVVEGDGRGSKITMALKEAAGGTDVKYSASMELGPLGFFAKGPAKGNFEKTVDEDMAAMDALQ
jgi:carbon monoxide dehydrogenase subunit G